MKASGYLAVVLGLILCLTGSAQVVTNAPKVCKSVWPIRVSFSSFGITTPTLQDIVYQEVLNPELVSLISKSVKLGDSEQKLFQVVVVGSRRPMVYKLTDEWSPKCDEFVKTLETYMRARSSGHTVECLREGLTNRQAFATNSDPDLAILVTNVPFLPPTWFKKAKSGTKTNRAGQVMWKVEGEREENGKMTKTNYSHIPKTDEVCRWVTYTISDGGLAWSYYMSFKPDGALERLSGTKFDSKEIDPQYQEVMKEVEAEIAEELKDVPRQLGAIHTYWGLKKHKLKARGIDWRSPAEVNPGAVYD